MLISAKIFNFGKGSIMSFFAKQSSESKAPKPNAEVIEIDQSSQPTSDVGSANAETFAICGFKFQDTSQLLRCEFYGSNHRWFDSKSHR